MTDNLRMAQSGEEFAAFTPPYPPGWLDRLTDWVKQLPGPSWLYYLGLVVVQGVYAHVWLWFNGKTPVGTIDLPRVYFVVIAPYFLWVRTYLDHVASAALDAFRPALTVGDGEFARLRYELTTLPARNTLIVTALAALLSVPGFVLLPTSLIQQFAPSLKAALIQFGPLQVLALVVILVSTYHAIHQLRMVDHIHDLAKEISLFRSRPLYAFSGLTARTGVSFLLLAYYVIAVRPDVASGNLLATALFIAIIPIAVACFVLPLRGIHQRIAAERERLLTEANRRFEALIAKLHQRVDDGVLADADKLNHQMAGLTNEREALAKISTWPWDTKTLTGFVTTVIVPVVLWLLPRVLQRFGF